MHHSHDDKVITVFTASNHRRHGGNPPIDGDTPPKRHLNGLVSGEGPAQPRGRRAVGAGGQRPGRGLPGPGHLPLLAGALAVAAAAPAGRGGGRRGAGHGPAAAGHGPAGRVAPAALGGLRACLGSSFRT